MKKLSISLLIALTLLLPATLSAKTKKTVQTDREYWCSVLYQIASPVLSNMSRGELKQNMMVELSPTWDGRNVDVTYLETFGRLMAGLAPWLALPDDGTPEGQMRHQLREWALTSYKNAVNPDSPDYLLWKGENQILVDAAYLVQSFMRAPQALWEPLDQLTKQRYIDLLHQLDYIRPAYNNWLLFRIMIEAFFVMVDEPYDGYAVEVGLRKMNEWYVGDGIYSDGTETSVDYYNSYVIHPMLVEALDIFKQKNVYVPISLELAVRRMNRYNTILERLISPEGTYPAVGRSLTYRMAAFQSLALGAWKYGLPQGMSNGQVRSALTAVMKNMFSREGNFNEGGFLRLGYVGHQPNLADYYTDNGSLYMTSLVFLPLGLPADHPFWTEAPEDWTSKKAWNGEIFPKDYHESIQTSEKAFLQENINYCSTQLQYLLQKTGEPTGNNFPRTEDNDGQLVLTSKYDWTPGFFPGVLWNMYELTGDSQWKTTAEKWTRTLESQKSMKDHHDIGFIMYCSYGNAQRLAPQDGYEDILTESARSLCTRFNPTIGAIESWNYRKAWNTEEWFYPVIIDNMMNLELLCHATKVTHDSSYVNIAIQHANTTLANQFRPDYSSYHVVNYDEKTGKALHHQTCQGYSDNSTWSRGQAWAIYGYTMMYRETGIQDYLDAACHFANYYLRNLPEDYVPAWDFNAGEEGYQPDGESGAKQFITAAQQPKDASAAAIACSALFELGQLTQQPLYINYAVKILKSLASKNYRAALGTHSGFLLKHCTGSIPHDNEIDKPLVYADYYFLEALNRYKRILKGH